MCVVCKEYKSQVVHSVREKTYEGPKCRDQLFF